MLSHKPLVVRLLSLLTVAVLLASCRGGRVYVSALEGCDRNDGSRRHPVATLARAQELVRAPRLLRPATVLVDSGTYYLPETLVLTAADNGTTWRSRHPQAAVISGGSRMDMPWQETDTPGLWTAPVEAIDSIDQFYVNGICRPMARYPNRTCDERCNVYDCWRLSGTAAADTLEHALAPRRVASWTHPEGGYVHAMHAYLWGDMHWLVTGRDTLPDGLPDLGHLRLVGGWQNNRPSPMHPRFCFVENIREELDQPGEWYYDADDRLLYYRPEPTEDMHSARCEIVRLKTLLRFEGTELQPVRKVHFEGFTFCHAARTFMENREPLLRSDWTVSRTAAIVYHGAEECRINDCDFDQVGGNTILADGYNEGLVFHGCYIHDSGASGIVFVGDSSCVRFPMFDYGRYTPYDVLDTLPGPRSQVYPRHCLVEECLITRTGRYEKQTAPVEISMAYGIRVSHCSLYEVPRAGINISEGTFGGHTIEHCDVFETVLETGDHGSFNAWGRDRFWGQPKVMARYVAEHPGAEQRDMLAPNTLRHNRWRCDHGWDVDLDDGSSNYIITDNLLLHGGLKMREGYHRRATNNLIINNTLHPHVWMPQSGDVFAHNVVFGAYRPAAITQALGPADKWGERVDSNFFACPDAERTAFIVNGCDSCSLSGAPVFADPAQGDYTITNLDATAGRVGFRPFRMDNFGVTDERLRALARHPAFPQPEVRYVPAASEAAATFRWNGASLTFVKGEALSAYGMDIQAKGLAVVDVKKDSPARKAGLRTGDLIIEINGTPIEDEASFAPYEAAPGNVTHLALVRDQQRHTITCR